MLSVLRASRSSQRGSSSFFLYHFLGLILHVTSHLFVVVLRGRCVRRGGPPRKILLAIIADCLRRGFAYLEPRADFLDLRGERRHSPLEFLNFAMLFEKLIKQHRVHLVVTHAVWFAFLVARH